MADMLLRDFRRGPSSLPARQLLAGLAIRFSTRITTWGRNMGITGSPGRWTNFSRRWTSWASRRLVDLDGGWGETIFDAHLAHFKEPHPDRFLVFGGIEWDRWPAEGNRFGEVSARRLEAQVQRGAEGLKVWKVLGLRVRDQNGARCRGG